MKKLIFVFTALALALTAQAKKDELGIAYEQIPEKAQMFVTEFYKDVPVKRAAQKFDDGIAEYIVYLKNKTVLEFDMVGAWSEIEVPKGMSISTQFLPVKVNETLIARFIDKKIYKIENDGYWYEAKFTDGSEVKINANGEIVDYDAD